MKIINENNLKVLIADEGKALKSKNDNYEEKHTDTNGNVIEEHFPYYFTKAYIPPTMTIDKATEQYDELNDDEVVEAPTMPIDI